MKASEFMTSSPIVISPEEKSLEAEKMMNEKKITTLPVCQDSKILGAIQLYDI